MSTLRATVITPSYQQVDYLEECLRSVADQGVPVEHIVVDGGSTDGSREVIERHAERLAWWCSEQDEGQSHAINKGLAHATGDVFTWVNSDDALTHGAVPRVLEAFAADPSLQVFGGQVVHRDAHGDRVFDRLNDAHDAHQLWCDPVINQPATWYRMDVVRELGGVDPALRYVMDLSLWWRFLFRHGTAHLRFEPAPLAIFRLHDTSKTVTAHAGFLDETASLLHEASLAVGEERFAGLLAGLHDLRPGLKPLGAGPEHRDRVRRMVVRFLLKWHGTVHSERDFVYMRKALPLLASSELDAWEQERHGKLQVQLRPRTWLGFRLRRKLRHLGA